MAGGLNASVVMCLQCLGRAVRTGEGFEDDWYRCEACGASFGVDWSCGAPSRPCWPPSPQELEAARAYLDRLRGRARDADSTEDPA